MAEPGLEHGQWRHRRRIEQAHAGALGQVVGAGGGAVQLGQADLPGLDLGDLQGAAHHPVDMAAVLAGGGQAAGVAGAETAEQSGQWCRPRFAAEQGGAVALAEDQAIALGVEGPVGAAGTGQVEGAEALLGDGAGRFEGQHQHLFVCAAGEQASAVQQAIGGAGAGSVESEGIGKAMALAQPLGHQVQRRGVFEAEATVGCHLGFQLGDVQRGAGDDQQAVAGRRIAQGFAQQAIQACIQRLVSGDGEVGARLLQFVQLEGRRLRPTVGQQVARRVAQVGAQGAVQGAALQVDRGHFDCRIKAAISAMLARILRPSLAPSMRTP